MITAAFLAEKTWVHQYHLLLDGLFRKLPNMSTTVNEVLQFVKENEVKFVRLSFCDLLGVHKNIAIMTGGLESAFENGVSIDPRAVSGFREETQSDLLLFPDPATLIVLPWRPGPGRVVRFYCDIKKPDGSAYSLDSRCVLKQTIRRIETKGYRCKVGAECEFYLFKTDEDGNPTDVTFDTCGYLDISPLDRCENMRREICLTLDEMGIKPETSHHEQGPGQNEIDFESNDALTCADNFQTFKSVVKAVASRSGLFASFMPKPLLNAPGSGMHINLSLVQNGLNIFRNAEGGLSTIAENFVAGILAKTPEMTVFLNPLTNSYERFGEFEAPKYVSWSHQNRSLLINIPAAVRESGRIEVRSPDPSANPYLAFALIIAAGFDGIEKEMVLPPPVNADMADKSIIEPLARLPESLEQAILLAKGGGFVKRVVGEELLSKYLALKETEASEFAAAENKAEFYKNRYFKNT